jgi:hypothetical protein
MTPSPQPSPIEGEGGLVINVYSGEWIGYEQVCYEIWRRRNEKEKNPE